MPAGALITALVWAPGGALLSPATPSPPRVLAVELGSPDELARRLLLDATDAAAIASPVIDALLEVTLAGSRLLLVCTAGDDPNATDALGLLVASHLRAGWRGGPRRAAVTIVVGDDLLDLEGIARMIASDPRFTSIARASSGFSVATGAGPPPLQLAVGVAAAGVARRPVGQLRIIRDPGSGRTHVVEGSLCLPAAVRGVQSLRGLCHAATSLVGDGRLAAARHVTMAARDGAVASRDPAGSDLSAAVTAIDLAWRIDESPGGIEARADIEDAVAEVEELPHEIGDAIESARASGSYAWEWADSARTFLSQRAKRILTDVDGERPKRLRRRIGAVVFGALLDAANCVDIVSTLLTAAAGGGVLDELLVVGVEQHGADARDTADMAVSIASSLRYALPSLPATAVDGTIVTALRLVANPALLEQTTTAFAAAVGGRLGADVELILLQHGGSPALVQAPVQVALQAGASVTAYRTDPRGPDVVPIPIENAVRDVRGRETISDAASRLAGDRDVAALALICEVAGRSDLADRCRASAVLDAATADPEHLWWRARHDLVHGQPLRGLRNAERALRASLAVPVSDAILGASWSSLRYDADQLGLPPERGAALAAVLDASVPDPPVIVAARLDLAMAVRARAAGAHDHPFFTPDSLAAKARSIVDELR